MSNDGLGDSTSHFEQPVALTESVTEEQQSQQQQVTGSSREQDDKIEVTDESNAPSDQQQPATSHGEDARDNAASDEALRASEDTTATNGDAHVAEAESTSPSQKLDNVLTAVEPASEAASTAAHNSSPGDNPPSTDSTAAADQSTSASVPSDAAPSTSSPSATTPSISAAVSADLEPSPSEGSTSNAGSNAAAPTTSSTKAAAPPKKFTSSLSMNKKFLGKSGATDSKSPQPAHASIPKPGLSPVARSPALASPGIPVHPGTSASPPITASTSAPRLLTGKLSSLASGSGGGSAPPPSSSATWGRPGLATGAAPGAAFGKTGFVPAGQVGGPQGSGGPRLGGPPMMQQSLGRMRGAFGQQSRAGQAPWAGANRGAGGFSRGGSLDQEFPSFQEAAKAEEQRQHALLAKDRAEKLAVVAQAAYNQRVLDGLKSFSGEYTSNATHWDELDDDDDDLGDILEFADGTRYEVPQSATMPTEAETAAFEQALQAEKEAVALNNEYRESLEREQRKAGSSSSATLSPADKSERFVDDFDRGAKAKAQAEQQQASAAPPASRQPASGRTLFNDRLGRFEPYAGRAPPAGRKDSKDSKHTPPSVLQRPARVSLPPQDQVRPPPQRAPSGQHSSNAARPTKSPLLPTAARPQTQAEAPQHQKADTVPRKVESPWAKLPPVTQQPETPTSGVATATQDASSASAPQLTPIAATPAAQPIQAAATPATPAEDPEEAYKREMRSIADQARKRRQDEEAEREAQKARAMKKAQEIEEKMKAAAQKDAPSVSAPVPTPTSAKPTPTTILSPPASKSDRLANWRKSSVDIKSTQDLQKQAAPTPTSAQSNRQDIPFAPATRQTRADTKASPTQSTSLTSAFNTPTTRHPSSKAEGEPRPATHKRDSVLHNARAEVASASRVSPGQASAPAENDEATSPPVAAPRVRLGRRTPPREGIEDVSAASAPTSSGVPHAFPQPTILVGRHAKPQEGQAGSQPVSALDKIMSQVRAAQDDLKTRHAAAAMLEEERKKMQNSSSSKDDFDGALDRISKALNQATLKAKARENVPTPIKMNPPVVAETFEQTLPERPQSPRIWKTFNVKIPTVLRSEVRDLPAFRVRAFEDPFFPPPIYSSSWIPPKGLRLPRNMSLEEYLFANEDPLAQPRVKVSKLYLATQDSSESPSASGSNAVAVAETAGHTASSVPVEDSNTADKASLDSDAFVRNAPASAYEEEDVATISFREDEDDEDAPAVIKVSLPRHSSPPSQQTSSTATLESASLEAGRFKTYGPRLPQNSTVAFRRGISPSKALDTPDSLDKHMFMVNSELSGSKEEGLPSFMRSYDQQVVDEVSAPSKAFAAVGTSSRHDLRPSPPLEPVFPSLSPAERNADNAETGSQSSFNGMRREELPRHVIAELERLNATVSATPLTNPPRLDSPTSLLAGRSTSPWATGHKATMMPSALSLSAIDPSMSLWSKPTEETAAAAAAAFNSASKDAANDSVQENSLKDLVDDYPSSMPSNAMDLPISEGERPQSKDSETQRRSPSRSRSDDRRSHTMSISQVISSSSPHQSSMPLTGRSREHGSSRHGSFNFSPAQGYPVEGSPYGVSAQLPSSMYHQTVYSPSISHPQAHAQYGGYVSSTPTYATGYQSANGMVMSPAYSSPYSSQYSSVPVTMTAQDGRSMPSHMSGQNGSVWVPNTSIMNGSFTSGTAISPYGSVGIPPSGQGYASNRKPRLHTYAGQTTAPTGRVDSHQHQHQGYGSYGGYTSSVPSSALPQHSPQHHYSTFSPQLTSPAPTNGSMNHPRSASASAQQYGGRRQGW